MTPFTRRRTAAVSAWGEEKLIAAIRRWLGNASPKSPFGIGDDCAVLPRSRGPQLVTVDPVVHGRHFDDSTPPRLVGAKLLKRNLSDLAAMGGRPVAAVLSLTMAREVKLLWLEEFYRGLAATARAYGVSVVGGDIAQADRTLVASLTLLGEAAGRRVVTRNGARVGDWIFVTGELGNSLASGHHLKFRPRLAEGEWLAGHAGVRSMMDLSDGLAKDLRALTPAGAAPALSAEAIPRRSGADLRGALADGEDYELVFTFSERADREAFQRAWRRRFPRTRLSCLGRFARHEDIPAGALNLGGYHGYEHLR